MRASHARSPRLAPATPPPAARYSGDEVGERVAPVGEGVQHDLRNALAGGELDAGAQVGEAGVDAAARDQADQVQRSGAVARRRACRPQRRVLEEAAVRDRLVDAGEVLLDDRAGAEVQVADLGVAHLARGQARPPRPQASSCVCG